MSVEVKRTSNAQTPITSDAPTKKSGPPLAIWLLPAIFFGLSGFILIFRILDSMPALEGNLFPIKILISLVAGIVGFVATPRSGLFDQG